MKKTSINSLYINLWATAAGLLQGLTVIEMFVKSRNDWYIWISLEQNFIDAAVNERRKCLLTCVHIMGQHFKQFYYS